MRRYDKDNPLLFIAIEKFWPVFSDKLHLNYYRQVVKLEIACLECTLYHIDSN